MFNINLGELADNGIMGIIFFLLFIGYDYLKNYLKNRKNEQSLEKSNKIFEKNYKCNYEGDSYNKILFVNNFENYVESILEKTKSKILNIIYDVYINNNISSAERKKQIIVNINNEMCKFENEDIEKISRFINNSNIFNKNIDFKNNIIDVIKNKYKNIGDDIIEIIQKNIDMSKNEYNRILHDIITLINSKFSEIKGDILDVKNEIFEKINY